ncbi:hypothetical protein AB0J20_02715 [Micromonospora costi]|uniref:hypothetical protein n=1 Tax=Micromonospora costi TaxID=1530042 RepID=UPI0033CA11F0
MPQQHTHRRVVMAERPTGPLAPRHLRREVVAVPPRPSGAVLLRNILVPVAPGRPDATADLTSR